MQSDGWLSFLVWNQKDTRGKYVGNGVYIWKVAFKSRGRAPELGMYRQGIARTSSPERGCAVVSLK
jgi:hypothetical protein